LPRFAVTGANGFVGRHLVEHLARRGFNVVAVVRDRQASDLVKSSNVEVRQADIRNPAELRKALAGTDGVFHLAALFNRSDCTWQDFRDTNVTGAVNVVAAARACGVRRIVHCSTVGVATEAHEPPYDENTPYSPNPTSRYEVTKAEGEQAVIAAAAEHAISLSVVRPTQVYGPGDRSKLKFYQLVRKGWVIEPGDTLKHPIYVADLCEGFERAMNSEAANGEIFLIGNQEPVRLADMIALAARTLGVKLPRRLPRQPAFLACTIAERISRLVGIRSPIQRRSMDFFTRSIAVRTDKARRLLEFKARTSLARGIELTVAWYRSEKLFSFAFLTTMI
jgi:dihydroflavonol-4-reductase